MAWAREKLNDKLRETLSVKSSLLFSTPLNTMTSDISWDMLAEKYSDILRCVSIWCDKFRVSHKYIQPLNIELRFLFKRISVYECVTNKYLEVFETWDTLLNNMNNMRAENVQTLRTKRHKLQKSSWKQKFTSIPTVQYINTFKLLEINLEKTDIDIRVTDCLVFLQDIFK